jgi:hypothetical protein
VPALLIFFAGVVQTMKYNFVYLGLYEWIRKKGLKTLQDINDVDDNLFKKGKDWWILKTFKYLRNSNLNPMLSDKLEKNAINILHHDDFSMEMAVEHFVVCVRADRNPAFCAQVEIVQNGLHADNIKRFFLPHWPQDGIITRNPHRKGIKQLSYFGNRWNISPELESAPFKEFCREHGLIFNIQETDWSDYHSTDLVIAFRDGFSFFLDCKPSSKLVNSWFAGVPSILNPEYGYCEIATGAKDAIFVNSIDQLLSELKTLVETPQRYTEIVNSGQRRAEEFSVDKISEKWVDQLKHIGQHNYSSWRKRNRLHRSVIFYFSVLRTIIWGEQVVQYPNNLLRNVKSYLRIFLAAPALCIKQLTFAFCKRWAKRC